MKEIMLESKGWEAGMLIVVAAGLAEKPSRYYEGVNNDNAAESA